MRKRITTCAGVLVAAFCFAQDVAVGKGVDPTRAECDLKEIAEATCVPPQTRIKRIKLYREQLHHHIPTSVVIRAMALVDREVARDEAVRILTTRDTCEQERLDLARDLLTKPDPRLPDMQKYAAQAILFEVFGGGDEGRCNGRSADNTSGINQYLTLAAGAGGYNAADFEFAKDGRVIDILEAAMKVPESESSYLEWSVGCVKGCSHTKQYIPIALARLGANIDLVSRLEPFARQLNGEMVFTIAAFLDRSVNKNVEDWLKKNPNGRRCFSISAGGC